MNKTESYRLKAADCERLAKVAISSEARESYQRQAKSWRMLADAREPPQTIPKPTGYSVHTIGNLRRHSLIRDR